jgi:hypothetical protein
LKRWATSASNGVAVGIPAGMLGPPVMRQAVWSGVLVTR